MYVLAAADMLRRMPPAAVASATGIAAAMQSLAQIIASPLIGASLDKDHGWGRVMISLGLLALPGGLLWCLLKPPPLVDLDAKTRAAQAV